MFALSDWLTDPAHLTPLGLCLQQWQPRLIWTAAAADFFTATSCLAIALALGMLSRRRRDLLAHRRRDSLARPVFVLFAAVIALCGTAQFFDLLVLWVPAYPWLALVKAGRAIASLAAAIAAWRFLPDALEPVAQATGLQPGRTSAEAAGHERLFDMVKVAPVMVREINGTIRFWSEGCQRLYGWSAEEAIGRSSHELLRTVFPVSLADTDSAMLRDGAWTGELRHRTKTNAEVTVAATMTLRDHADRSGRLVVEILTDVTALRATQMELQASEAQFASLVETAADGFVVAHADGRIKSVNRALLSMFGYDRAQDVIGQNLRVLMPADEAMRHDSYIAAHRAGAPPRVIGVPGCELLAIRRDGATFPIDLSVSSFAVEGTRFLTAIIRDATARRQAEAALHGSEARLRLVQQVGGVAYSDQIVSEPERLISREFVQLYGLSPMQTHISDKDWAAALHPEDRDRVVAERSSILQHGGTLTTEFRIRRSDGALRWVTMRTEMFLGSDGGPNRAICAQQDITEIVAARQALSVRQHELEQRVAERTRALAEAEARFRGIFDSQFQFINLLSPDGTILETNRTALDAGGLTRGEVIGRPIWETAWWPGHERDQLRAEIAQAARGAVVRREIEISGAGGRTIWADFSLTPTREPTTNAVKWIIAEGRDLTEKRHMANQLAQAQKGQALGQLAAGIAHDFNNILQAVSGAASLIERAPGDHGRTIHLAATIVAAAHRGSSITQRLLSFARRGELRAEPLATADLLGNMREVLQHTLGTAITVLAIIPPDIPALVADQAQLETAIINLGTNARDAMPDGGTLILSAEAEQVGAEDRHPAGLEAGDYVRLGIADTGTGMDAATLARVSEPFFTTKPTGQGTGLGVAMVKGFAEQSGGALSIASTPGVGTKVWVWLRQATGGTQGTGTAEAVGRHGNGFAARILVVDDDDLVREMLAASLEEAGFATLVASGGLEAVALVQAGETVDAMVSDLSMPGINGVATIRQVRALLPRLPCFLLTGYVGERAALAADDMFTLVRKPISTRSLVAQIEAGLESARQ